MEIPLLYYNLLALASGFAIALAFVWFKPRSILLLAALAVVLFLLFGVFSIPGFFLGLGAKAILFAPKPAAKKTGRRRG